MGVMTRVLRGNPLRKTRFHDEKGNLVDPGGMAYAPAALATAVLRTVFGYRAAVPTISYRARKAIASLLDEESRVVEFGSGMSTPWLARRCRFLLSIEDDPRWFGEVQALLAARGLTNVRLEMRDPETYAALAGYPDAHFDFALVDGTDRAGCLRSVLPKLRPGGWIYLDNTDKDMTLADGDSRRAEALLLEAARRCGGPVRYFVDFSPTNFFVEQGMLVRITAPSATTCGQVRVPGAGCGSV